MLKNTINESEIFSVSNEYDVTVENYDGVKVLIVDNFYKNPHDVRKLALDIPASYNYRIRGNNPAHRINAFYEMSPLATVYDRFSRECFPEITTYYDKEYFHRSFMNATFMINVMQTNNLPPVCPHMDNTSGINLASTIYLNTDEECAGGTSFYKFGGKPYYEDTSVTHTLDVEGKHPVNEYITDSIMDWELIGIAPMKFNRMVLYNQAVLHSAYVKPHMFTGDLYRLNQQFFI